jgi:hypothetical protein
LAISHVLHAGMDPKWKDASFSGVSHPVKNGFKKGRSIDMALIIK